MKTGATLGIDPRFASESADYSGGWVRAGDSDWKDGLAVLDGHVVQYATAVNVDRGVVEVLMVGDDGSLLYGWDPESGGNAYRNERVNGAFQLVHAKDRMPDAPRIRWTRRGWQRIPAETA